MSKDTQSKPNASASGKRRGKRLLLVLAVGLVMLVVGVIALTSSTFLKGFLLPRVGDALSADIEAGRVGLSLTKQLELQGLAFSPKGEEPLLEVDKIDVQYRLFDIIGGSMNVPSVTIEGAKFNLEVAADGSSNLSRYLEKLPAGGEEKQPRAKSEEPIQLDVGEVTLKEIQLNYTWIDALGHTNQVSIPTFSLTLSDLGNAETAVIELGGEILARLSGAEGIENVNSSFQGQFNINLNEGLLPTAVKGTFQEKVGEASGRFEGIANSVLQVDVDMAPERIENVGLSFVSEGTDLGRVAIKGPFDWQKGNGQLDLVVGGINNSLLNMLGYDFGKSEIGFTSSIDIGAESKLIRSKGTLEAKQLGIVSAGGSTPNLDVELGFDAGVNIDESSLALESFLLTATEKGEERVTFRSSEPVNFSWGEQDWEAEPATLAGEISQLDLGPWLEVFGLPLESATVSSSTEIKFEPRSKRIGVELSLDVEGIKGELAVAQLRGHRVKLDLSSELSELKSMTLNRVDLEFLKGRTEVAMVNLGGTMNLESYNHDLRLALAGDLEAVSALCPSLPLDIDQGALKISATGAGASDQTSSLGLEMTVNNLKGSAAGQDLTGLELALKAQPQWTSGELGLPEIKIDLGINGEQPDSIMGSGRLNLENETMAFKVQSDGIRHPVLNKLLNVVLGQKQLAKGSTSFDADIEKTQAGVLNTQLALGLKDWEVKDREAKQRYELTSLNLSADSSVGNQEILLRSVKLVMAPTERAKNELFAEGTIPIGGEGDGLRGRFSVKADSLDVTPLYEIFGGASKGAEDENTDAEESQEPMTEPEPIKLPFERFDVDLDIKKLILGAIEITDFKTVAAAESTQVKVEPLELKLNGAPVKANTSIDFSVPGYRYELALMADHVPWQPIADTFIPLAKERTEGEIIASANIKGQGVTGKSLAEYLNGQLSCSFTNANVKLVGNFTRALLTPIMAVLRAPEILQSPLYAFGADLKAGDGHIDVGQIKILTDAFQANTAGRIPISDTLSLSALNLPLNIGLKRELATRANLLPSGTMGDSPYVDLPNFVELQGALGEMKVKTDKMAISGLVLKSTTAIPSQVVGQAGERAGEVIEGVGSLIEGFGDLGLKRKTKGATNDSTKSEGEGETSGISPSKIFDLLPRRKR